MMFKYFAAAAAAVHGVNLLNVFEYQGNYVKAQALQISH